MYLTKMVRHKTSTASLQVHARRVQATQHGLVCLKARWTR